MTAVVRLRRSFRVVFLLPVLLVVALGAWAFASPVGSSPDDDFHLSSIWCANPFSTDYCKPGDTPASRYVPELVKSPHICFNAHPEISAECQNKLDFSSEPTELTTRGSFANSYPPIYYFTMSLFVGPNIVVSVLLMRFVNILLFVGIGTALFVLLPNRLRVPLAWSWLVSIVPLGVFLLASNNPSSWAMIGVGTVWASLLGFFETTGKRRVALGALFVVGAVMAAGARADSAVYTVVAIGGVLILTFSKSKDFLVRAILPMVLAAVAFTLYATSGQSSVATAGLGSIEQLPEGRDKGTLLIFNLLHVSDLFTGVFGSWGLGWLDVFLPPIVTFGAVTSFVAVVFVGLSSAPWRKILVLAGTAGLLIALPVYVLIQGGNEVGEVLQPRYLLPLIMLFAGFALYSARSGFIRLARAQSVYVAAALVMANTIALHVDVRRYVTGSDEGGLNLDNPNEWWWSSFPLSPMGVWAIGAVAFGAAVVLLVRELSRISRLHEPAGEAPLRLDKLD